VATAIVVAAAGPVSAQYAQTEIDLPYDTQDFTAYGITDSDGAGATVVLGDLNGDGILDGVIAASGASGPGNTRGANVGEVYLRFGARTYPRTQDFASAAPDVTIYGVAGGDQLARSMAAGDLNGDGTADLVMRLPNADGPDDARAGGGQEYVMYGRRT